MLFGFPYSERPEALGSRVYIICAGGGVGGEAGWFGELRQNNQAKPNQTKPNQTKPQIPKLKKA